MIAGQQQPRAQGDLATTPFAHLVLYLHREGLSGTLVVDRGGFETKVLFRNGKAVAARPLPRGTGLQDGLQELSALVDARYAFWDEDLLGDASGVVKGTVDALSFVTDALRKHARDAVMLSVIERYRGRRLVVSADADAKRLGLHGAEARALDRLRSHSMTAEELAAHSGLGREETRRLLYLLLITGYVSPEGADSSSSSGVRAAVDPVSPSWTGVAPGSGSSPAAASSLPPSKAASSRPAGPGSARRAPTQRSSQPSLPAQPIDPSSPPTSARPTSQSSLPAWQQLASLRAGVRPSSSPSVRAPTPSMAPPPVETLDDAGKLRRAEQLVERRNYDEATRIVHDLVRRDAKNADYAALRALILYQQLTGNRLNRPLIDAIEGVLSKDPQHPRGLYLKGLVYKRMGKEADAVRYFQKTLEADPKHLEAQRELRLAKMRRER